MNFQYTEECEDPVHIIELNITQRKYNRTTHVLDFTLNTPYGYGDFMTTELQGAVKKQGGYKPGVANIKGPACSLLYVLMGDILPAILNGAGVTDCPLPPGNYSLLNFYFNHEIYI
ncbi:uncharacterized protein LOC113227883 isoform X2 [Hyposmocoma kahamanoa]|uniref:uncharacterized protein LOC113227883 isoform X2 n=1 Tax=Hyposmocoma kahamanoa TaxID=1477025 RepID=UPI000E6D5BCF|nr:uncharacterized protein LOC113227883 isoform X2 [Hyposmocoma kahamanoa]